jgi:hypothetical protein
MVNIFYIKIRIIALWLSIFPFYGSDFVKIKNEFRYFLLNIVFHCLDVFFKIFTRNNQSGFSWSREWQIYKYEWYRDDDQEMRAFTLWLTVERNALW